MVIIFGDSLLWNGDIGGYKHYKTSSLHFSKISLLTILLLCLKVIPLTGKKWNENINRYILSRLEYNTNAFTFPTVQCPWGCTGFKHKIGDFPIDLVFQRYFLRCWFETFYDKFKIKIVLNARKYYICDNSDENSFFMNPLCTTFTSIYFSLKTRVQLF